MDNNIVTGFVSAFFGAIVGSFTSIWVVVIQERSARRRERSRLAVESAIEDRKGLIEILLKKNMGGTMPPLFTFIHYHAKLLDLMDRGKLSPETFKKLSKEHSELMKEIEKDS